MQFRLDCTTVVCKNCGFCFVSPAPTREAYDRFYREAYSTYYRGIHGSSDVDRTSRRLQETPAEAERFRTIERFKTIDGSSVLEIGPGEGRFLRLIANRGAHCSAVEPSADFRARLAKAGIETVGEFIERVEVNRVYDLVCFFQVLEHFHDPRLAMSVIRELTAPNGLVVLDVPNIKQPFRSLDRYFLRYVHLSYFSPTSLRRLLTKFDFDVIWMETGDAREFRKPQSIFVIARKLDGPSESRVTRSEDWRAVVQDLERYRWTYALHHAPRLKYSFAKRGVRRLVSNSAAGALYRRAKRGFRSR
ncbi:MAG: class I SAM-dependent methyltransferase [Deltaproteobacteria bacterium]|nr:class I SAM-dependent methyltransferase [Deltaproteobacteria bacterium]